MCGVVQPNSSKQRGAETLSVGNGSIRYLAGAADGGCRVDVGWMLHAGRHATEVMMQRQGHSQSGNVQRLTAHSNAGVWQADPSTQLWRALVKKELKRHHLAPHQTKLTATCSNMTVLLLPPSATALSCVCRPLGGDDKPTIPAGRLPLGQTHNALARRLQPTNQPTNQQPTLLPQHSQSVCVCLVSL